MMKRLVFLVFSLAVLVGMGLATTAAVAGEGATGEVRWLWTGFNNEDMDGDVDDNYAYSALRSRLGYTAMVGERGKAHISFQNYYIFGDDPDMALFDSEYYPDKLFQGSDFEIWLNEAYLSYKDFLFEGFHAKAGRFGLSYGRERILGHEDWSMNFDWRFDGFKGRYVMENGWLDLLCLTLVETFDDRFSSPYEGDTNLRGAYFHYSGNEEWYLEPYILWLRQTGGSDETLDPVEELDASSIFVFGALFDYMMESGFHLYGEGVMESGNIDFGIGDDDDVDVSTMAFYAGAFYTFDSEVEPFLGAEFNYASGWKEGDEEIKTFAPIAGSFSDYMGRMNMIGWSNTASFRVSGGLTPTEDLDLRLDFWMFKLASEDDFAYDVWGNEWMGVMDADGVFDKSVGTEIDFFLDYAMDENFDVEAGLGMFSYGDYFGPDSDLDSTMKVYLGARAGF